MSNFLMNTGMGALAGAQIGMFFGGVGAGPGALLGAAVGGLASLFSFKDTKTGATSGAMIGGVAGAALAPLTFGLSIPIGMIIGGLFGAAKGRQNKQISQFMAMQEQEIQQLKDFANSIDGLSGYGAGQCADMDPNLLYLMMMQQQQNQRGCRKTYQSQMFLSTGMSYVIART